MAINRLVECFWGEPEQTTFGRTILVKKQPAFVTISEDEYSGGKNYTNHIYNLSL
jgi:hypothetical protein